MFATIRKHQTWLWAVIIAGVIISFVVYFTPTVGNGDRGGGRRYAFGTIHGREINRKEYVQAYNEVKLGFFLRYGNWPDTAEARRFGFSLERETSNRLVLLDAMRELEIPVDETAVANWITERFSDPKHPGSAKANYDSFVKFELPRQGLQDSDLHRFVQHEVAVMHLVAVAGSPGRLVTPREAAMLYGQEHEQVECEAALFSVTNYLASVQVDPAELARFYTNRQSVYRVPEKVQVHYLKFEMTNYLAQAEEFLAKQTNLSTEIDRRYLASGPNYFTDTNGQVMPPDAAKSRIRQQLRDAQAILAARKEAARFATNLAAMQPVKAENLANLAASKGMTALLSDPFSEMEGPRRMRVRANFTETAFKLTPEEPFSSPLPAEDGVYLIALKQKFPSEVPSLENLQLRVTEDYRQDQALQMARKAAEEFHAKATNGLAQGKTFTALCEEAKVTPLALPKFSATTGSLPDLDRRLDLSQLRNAASGVAAGRVSATSRSRDGAFVLYVKARTPVPDADLKAGLPKFLAGLRQSQQFDAFNQWFRKQVEASHIDTIAGKDE